MALDRYDLKILLTLKREGRITKRQLAERIGLSTSPCWERMRKLEKRGFVTGYHADIDYAKLGRFCLVTTLVSLKSHRAHDLRVFEQTILNTEEVVECESIVGTADYIVRFMIEDMDHYQRVMDHLLDSDVGIVSYHSQMRSKVVKRHSTFPLQKFLTQQMTATA